MRSGYVRTWTITITGQCKRFRKKELTQQFRRNIGKVEETILVNED